MIKSNINTCFRILSVLLTVVIVSVCFLQPIAYANAATVAGGVLALLVASLLVSVGLVFDSTPELEAATNYAVAAIPDDIRQGLENALEFNNMPEFPTLTHAKVAGMTAAFLIGKDIYDRFKAWANETFGIDEAVEAGEDTVETPVADFIKGYVLCNSGGSDFVLPVYNIIPYKGEDFATFITNNSIWQTWNGSISIAGSNYTLVTEYTGTYYDKTIKETLDVYKYYVSVNGKSGSFTYGDTANLSHYFLGWDTNGLHIFFPHYRRELSMGWNVAGASTTLPSSAVQSIAAIRAKIDKPAYNYSPGMVYQDGVPIAITPEISGLIEKNYQDVINDYSLDNWDYNKTIEEMKQQLAELTATIDGVADYDALQQKIDALQKELDRLKGLVGAQTVDAVGGINELNDALIDSAIVINSLRDLIKAQEQEAARIAELEKELTAAKEKIQELTDSATGSIEVPIDPPVTGEIDFSPLLVFADFSKVFPFCIPFDITAMFKSLKTTPVAPKFEIPFEIPGVFKEKITFDLSYIESVMPMVRAFVLLGFAVVLAFVTSTVIKW